MRFCKQTTKTKKNLKVCFDVDPDEISITKKKEKILHKADINVHFATHVPPPQVFDPITPTNQSYQRLRGILPPEGYTLYIDGATEGIKQDLSGHFSKMVALQEGSNVFELKVCKGNICSGIVRVIIEKDTTAPITELFANGHKVIDRIVTSQYLEIGFRSHEKSVPVTTYYRLSSDNSSTEPRAFSGYLFIEEENVYNIEYWSVDSIGNEEVHRDAILVIDRTPPTSPIIDISDLPAKTRFSSVLVRGTCSSDTFQIRVNGIEALVDGQEWNVTINLLVEGVNTIEAIAYDEAENASIPAMASIVLDQTPPEIPKLIIYEPRTRASTERISGSQSEDTYKLLLNGAEGLIVLVNPLRWRSELYLTEGENFYEVVAEDDVGNQSLPLRFVVVKDTVPPNPPTIDPYPSRTNNPFRIFRGTVSEDTIVLYVNGKKAILHNGHWRIAIDLEEGFNEFELVAEDDVGNQSSPVFIRIEVDTKAPPIPHVDPIPFYLNVNHLLLKGDKSDDTVEIIVNGSSAGSTYPSATRWQKPIVLTQGLNVIEVQAADDLGNTSQAITVFTNYLPGPVEFSIDNVPHTVLSPSILVTGDKDKLAIILIDGLTNGISYPNGLAGKKWAAVLNLAVGSNTFSFQAIDPAGNRSIIETRTIIRQLPKSLHDFYITSVYGIDENVKVEGMPAPLLDIPLEQARVIYLKGKKPKETTVFANFGKVNMKNGENGDDWEIVLAVPRLRTGPLQLSLQGERVQDPPVIIVSEIVRVMSKFVGTISFKIGGTVDTEMPQNTSIVVTDFQINNTPSPIANVPIGSYIDVKPFTE